MDKMTLIYVKGPVNVPQGYVAPGNVLAALSRTALSAESPPPSGSTEEEKRTAEITKVGELIGAEMLVRSLLEKIVVSATVDKYIYNNVEFKVPFEQFALVTTDLDPDILKDPRRYYFDETAKRAQTLPPPAMNQQSPTVVLTTADITVTLPLADIATADLGVWVLIQPIGGSAKTQVRLDVINKGPLPGPKKILNGVLPSGPYSILTLVTGYQPTVSLQTV